MSSGAGTNNDGVGDNTDSAVIISVVVLVVAVIIIIVIITLWCYRRKTGDWPKPCRRGQRPPIYANPYGNKNNATRWRNVDGETNPVVVGHQADYRVPTPQHPKKVYSINERITEHLHEASDKLSKDPEHKSSVAGNVSETRDVTLKKTRSKSYDDNGNSAARAAALHRSIHSYSGEIGVYHDRTLPATLMMTSESKRQKFANEDTALKRSNSATPRSSANSKSSRNLSLSRGTGSNCMRIYNDFGPKSSAGQFQAKRNARRTSNLSSFVSSKPSNTSDYISDFDSLSRNDRWNLNRNRDRSQSQLNNSRVSECDSVLQESIADDKDNFANYKQRLETEDLRPCVPPLVLYRAEIDAGIENNVFIEKERLASGDSLSDDRTESQQNTMRSDAFRNSTMRSKAFQNYSFSMEEERSCAEGQSSDTESMTGSASAAANDRTRVTKRRLYESDNEVHNKQSRRNRTRRKRRSARRLSSDGWESEPSQSTTLRKSKQRHNSQSFTRNNGNEIESSSRSRPKVIGSDEIQSKSLKSPQIGTRKNWKAENKLRVPTGTYNSSSLKSPIIGPLVEMPIYSQATWSGPGTSRSQFSKKSMFQKATGGSMSRVKKMKKSKNPGRAERKLSIGGGGRFYCEFDSLTIDHSKLPRDLIEKIGGKTDKLLEPIEGLNFDQLCKPLPHLGHVDAQSSARHLVTDRLPPNHRDRELLSNTYEYVGTGLVTTDL